MSITRKFRGKRADNGEWVEGYLLESNTPEYHCYIVISFRAEQDNRHTDILECDIYEIIPETVGQYTGLTDKSGTKIFEGDIIKFDDSYWVVKHGIFYDNGFSDSLYGYYIELIGEKVCRFGIVYDPKNEFEVVGNVYDNPEMLKGGADNE